LEFAIGGITEKPTVIDDKAETREYLNLTVMIDHDVIDGAPAARFTARLAELVQECFRLVE
jgi:pyruvate/2-oxoglutarate dehydrogenase complex dihydrolipoamide acyltransferase (E2) component